jgi:hypothetical protein
VIGKNITSFYVDVCVCVCVCVYTKWLLFFSILKKLKRFPKLTSLDVEGCFQITDVGLASIGLLLLFFVCFVVLFIVFCYRSQRVGFVNKCCCCLFVKQEI